MKKNRTPAKKPKKIRFETIHPASWDKFRLDDILCKIQGKKILVIGDVGLDRYTVGTVERISPEAPVPIVLVQEEQLKLGLAANVADNVQVLGGIPFLVGIVGKDRGAEDFRDLLNSRKILSTHLISDGSRRTVLKERVVSERQQIVRIDYESLHEIDPEIEKLTLKKISKLLPKVDAVIVEDYAKGALTSSLANSVFKLAKSAETLVAVDPNMKTPPKNYQGASILTPNTREAEHLSGISIRDEESLCKAGFSILKDTQAHHVVITRGKDGMAIFSRGNPIVRLIPTCAREVYDVSGAGDTVIAVLILALVSGATIEEASTLGNLAAGVEVGKKGTATVSAQEIRAAMDFFEIHSG